MPFDELPGIQSFAYGQYQGLWVIIGGRVEGLHRRQPFAAFLPEKSNTEIIVIDPVEKKIWRTPLTSLSLPLQDQLSSTNMEFHQDGDYLYLVGGYGHSQTIGSKLTYALLTAVDLRGVIYAVQHQSTLAPFFRQLTDKQFAVTGGNMVKLDSMYYLIGGHNFIGDYNPANNPTFTQSYTNAIRRFTLNDDGINLKVTHLPTIVDTSAFHKRDFNLVPQFFPDGNQGFTAFSGVFQLQADIPMLQAVNISADGNEVVPGFAQYYNHYHCANLPLYSSSTGEMHTVFFGGISQYFEHDGLLTEDVDIPFVNTIARVTRDQNGHMAEYKLPVELPALLGASAAFIRTPGIPMFENGVIKLDELSMDSTFAGYIYGGIKSSAPNIFWINEGEESIAQNRVYKVYVVKHPNTSNHKLNTQSINGSQLQIHTTSTEKTFTFNYHHQPSQKVMLTVTTKKGKILLQDDLSNQLSPGHNVFTRKIKSFKIGKAYLVTLTTNGIDAVQRVMAKE